MKFQVETNSTTEVRDITNKVESRLENESGLVNLTVQHTTAALTVNESESRLLDDIQEFIEEAVPDKSFRHDQIDNNASSHLRQLLLETSLTLPVENGKLQLGTWQSILFVELDGPRKRKVEMKVVEG